VVSPHAEQAVDPPDRQREAVLPERAVPRDRVLVVRVDERAVDVEECGREAQLARASSCMRAAGAVVDGWQVELIVARVPPGVPA
jgi:hypothetical protein